MQCCFWVASHLHLLLLKMGPSEQQQAETHWTWEESIQTSLGWFSLDLDPQLNGAAAHTCILC